ncbi:IclR family transcriptional regulator [Lampropedia puyangensis]|uniref:IclR family transcriptional regulator n=1 Tax=Lampropedia puyangensis TaxID=1330072 RepID=A0A4S8ETK0_9BURK|nr:IclR family transcriptional regulator C-terminal domain-containing protein [Lampropedia puyangensis]THT97570.1 IclR family transcriptional regulator [Lampropedia puyangensis]
MTSSNIPKAQATHTPQQGDEPWREEPPLLDAPVAPRDFVDALARGLALLESFGTERQKLNATQAAARAGLTRAAARRHLLTLTALGYLESDGHAFWLGPKVLRFSGSYLASARLPRLVQPTLALLHAQSHESHSVVVRDQQEVVIIARSGSPQRTGPMLAHGLHLGARLPLHATSTGRVLLAGLSDTELHHWLSAAAKAGLLRLTPQTVIEPERLQELVQRTRREGYSLTSQEHERGICALAVPLQDMQGRTHAALNVVVSAKPQAEKTLLQHHLPLLQAAAEPLRSML